MYGSIFENWVLSEKIKQKFNQGLESNYYFWRDQKGNEVDLVADNAGVLFPIEIKSSKTFHPSFLKNLEYLNALQKSSEGQVIFGGVESFDFKNYKITSWKNISGE